MNKLIKTALWGPSWKGSVAFGAFVLLLVSGTLVWIAALLFSIVMVITSPTYPSAIMCATLVAAMGFVAIAVTTSKFD